jgi:hypothetical protein
VLPPGLDTWDPTPYISCALPIFTSVLGVNFIHEVGHRIAAGVRKVKLGPTFFIPNLQIGSFGAITPIASLLKGRRDLWDVAAAGPIAGGLASLALVRVLWGRAGGRGCEVGSLRPGRGGGGAPPGQVPLLQATLSSITPASPLSPRAPPHRAPTPPQLIIGLQQSQQGGLPQELLVPVPTQLFQVRPARRAAVGRL